MLAGCVPAARRGVYKYTTIAVLSLTATTDFRHEVPGRQHIQNYDNSKSNPADKSDYHRRCHVAHAWLWHPNDQLTV